MKILVVEDDKQTLDYIAQGLRQHNHSVDTAQNGLDGLHLLQQSTFDVIILDRMIPNIDGLSLLKTMRQMNITTPVIFLTAMSQINDRVEGLTAGADDYLVKPFAFEELYARVISISRRPQKVEEISLLKIEDLEMDTVRRKVFRAGVEIHLQPTEFKLLEHLIKNAGRIITKTMLLERVWDFQFDPKTNVVETHISRLRSKVDKGFDKQLIQTVRGAGYTIDEA